MIIYTCLTLGGISILRVFIFEWAKLVRRRRLWILSLFMVPISIYYGFGLHQYAVRSEAMSPSYQIAGYEQYYSGLMQRLKTDPRNQQFYRQQLNNASLQIKILKNQELSYSSKDWTKYLKSELLSRFKSVRLQGNANTNAAQAQNQLMILIDKYELKNSVRPRPTWNPTAMQYFNHFMPTVADLIIPLIIVLLVADVLSSERNSGSIRLLIIQPISRAQILLGKWILGLTSTMIMTIIVMLGLFVIGTLMMGFGGLRQPVAVGIAYQFVPISSIINGSGIHGQSIQVIDLKQALVIPQWAVLIYSIGLTVLSEWAITSLVVLVSTLTASPLVSTVISLFIVCTGYLISRIADAHLWILPFYFTYLDLMKIWMGSLSSKMNMNISLWTGISVLIIWIAIPIILACWRFSRADYMGTSS
ncbi:ABC transporter permease [Ferroacidibacillus organovorans]|uniref:ABC transporter permease n=1 Tax=Ferroacidibacillus organovorans TaxID=1765683 RepID=A0A101XR02_9BACL|nr:ABC transporter permease subunit [Ferroacidibacillus organovorans]KUO95942.1 hypothetical protein ATW55_02345 [Ferroacidibacillus organovorans]